MVALEEEQDLQWNVREVPDLLIDSLQRLVTGVERQVKNGKRRFRSLSSNDKKLIVGLLILTICLSVMVFMLVRSSIRRYKAGPYIKLDDLFTNYRDEIGYVTEHRYEKSTASKWSNCKIRYRVIGNRGRYYYKGMTVDATHDELMAYMYKYGCVLDPDGNKLGPRNQG